MNRTMTAATVVLATASSLFAGAEDRPSDISWPREFRKGAKVLTVYQPQVDSWKDFKSLHLRCAISIEGVLKEEKFGVAEVDATTVVDHATRLVAITPGKRELRFANLPEDQAALLRAAAEELNPSTQVTIISLDRVLACLDASKHPVQRPVPVNLDPPKILYSAEPAILVMFLGKPMFKPLVASKPEQQFALNTNWDVLQDSAAGRYYLLDGEGWIAAKDPINGPWTPTSALPVKAADLPAGDNWSEARKHIPGNPADRAPKVFVSVEPAELIVTDGEPELRPIPGTKLSRVTNTESVLFRHSETRKFYFLVAGRWFAADKLGGPWVAASKSLPPDFAAIPDGDESEFVKASVPGTEEARDAVLLASVPNTTVVRLDEKPVVVAYDGPPKFVAIEGTAVQCAVNTPYKVFQVKTKYYCCEQGVWFVASDAKGPWAFATSVPAEIYAIPPSSPYYNVTYVVVQSSTSTTVTYCQTSGYSGEYVATTGVLMFGAGIAVGAAMASDHYYYYPPYPCYYSYGCAATYHYGYGGYYAAGYACYGPYGGAGYATAYNPTTGTYARSASAYGPYGSASRTAAYNPYTGARAVSTQASTAYGSAGRSAAYNPSTGVYAQGRYASGQYGTAGSVRTNQGTGAAAWNTQNSQGAVAKTKSGDVYATNGDTVYKKDSSGNWSSNSGNGWESASKPESAKTGASTESASKPQSAKPGASTASASTQSLQSQAQARQRGNQQTQKVSQYQSSAAGRTSGGGRSGSTGGRSRR